MDYESYGYAGLISGIAKAHYQTLSSKLPPSQTDNARENSQSQGLLTTVWGERGIVPASPYGDPVIPRRGAGPPRAARRPAHTRQIKTAPNGTVFIWRRGWDSNPRYACAYSGFRDRYIQPLCHLSVKLLQHSTHRGFGYGRPVGLNLPPAS